MKVTERTKEKFLAMMMVPTIIVTTVASFISEWWEMSVDGEITTYSIWVKTECFRHNNSNAYICIQSGTDNTGWIHFTRVMLVVALFLTNFSFLLQLIYMWVEKKTMLYTAIVFSGTAGFLILLINFVLMGAYHQISKTWLTLESRSSIPMSTLWFRTLPMGLLFLGAVFNSAIAICLTVKIDHKPKNTVKETTPVYSGFESVRTRRNIF